MYSRLLLFALLLLSLLSACAKEDTGPWLDLVGSTRYTSYDRTIATPGDTITFKLYSSKRNGGKSLSHIRIYVDYSPTRNPIVYPSNLASYNPKDDDKNKGETFVYLDSTLEEASDFVLQSTLCARTTSGREQWHFEATDTDKKMTRRGFRLQLRNADSALVYHRYTAQLQAPDTTHARQANRRVLVNSRRRSFLALLPGLTLPRYTVSTNPEARDLIDVVYTTDRTGAIYLAAANGSRVTHITKWNTRPTEFLTTGLNKTGFDNADTEAELTAPFTGNPASSTNIGPLAKEKVYAFRTKDGKAGLIYVQDILTSPVPTVLLQVHITK